MSVTEPVIKEIPEMRVISKREKGTFAATIGKLIGEICACVSSPENQRNRVKVTGPIMFLCHDEEYKETGADIEIAPSGFGQDFSRRPENGRLRPCRL